MLVHGFQSLGGELSIPIAVTQGKAGCHCREHMRKLLALQWSGSKGAKGAPRHTLTKVLLPIHPTSCAKPPIMPSNYRATVISHID